LDEKAVELAMEKNILSLGWFTSRFMKLYYWKLFSQSSESGFYINQVIWEITSQ